MPVMPLQGFGWHLWLCNVEKPRWIDALAGLLFCVARASPSLLKYSSIAGLLNALN